MNGTAMATDGRRKVRPGVGRGITATGRGRASGGRAAGQLGMLLFLLTPPILLGIAVAVLLTDHSTGFRQQVVLALVLVAAGLVAGWLAAVAAMLGPRTP